MNQLPELTLYYAAVATDRLSDRGNTIYDEYIYESELEAVASSNNYEIATWAIINMAADCGHYYPNKVLCTPQGKFILTEIYEEDMSGEYIVNDSLYRALGAPVAFSEAVEYHLFWTKGSELMGIVEEAGVYKAVIKNANGEKVIIRGG
ncbi:hypothetical protein SAMN04487895_101694 [Paenibacillus sophorae]|uniref:Uncharacterized protein n=1 Tax=Paenibacillus sophorae TaxID=1333845 RepID=A0A1H8GYL8_9BACL|nr:hypothetical protein [Paenibacillus sophorae]QWU14385.1 hypothetical protein KP014_20985 [Paenibacillus sophorae]SEN49182.1 hypothetical protein SAMN04487895_101694 [Paenibacillus sophorae]